jgi:hypothetical protein
MRGSAYLIVLSLNCSRSGKKFKNSMVERNMSKFEGWINIYHVVVLFDSRSSHLFVSQAFARKYEQKIVELECAYRISSAGADLLTN